MMKPAPEPLAFLSVRRRGASFVELIVYMVIFAIFLGGVTLLFTWYKHANSGIKRLDILHQIRTCSFVISEEISYGTQILFPPEDANKSYHQLLFKNNSNELLILFLNEKQQLMMMNLMKKKRGETYLKLLSNNTISFEVKRPKNSYVEYELTIKDEKEKEFHLANSARLRNVLK